tara:strand:+ start:5938 stop:6228 length:291 start_codon:yes stop_codon:yes gene_type:complete
MYFILSFFILGFLSILIGSSLSFISVKTKQYDTQTLYTNTNDVIEKQPIAYIPKNPKPEQNMKQEHTPEPDVNPIQQSHNTIPREYIVKPKYFKVI